MLNLGIVKIPSRNSPVCDVGAHRPLFYAGLFDAGRVVLYRTRERAIAMLSGWSSASSNSTFIVAIIFVI